MKQKNSLLILVFTTMIASAQVTQEDLIKEIKSLTQKVNLLQSENSKLKSEIGTLNSKLSNAYKSIDSLRTKSQDNSIAISQTANKLGIQIKETGDKNEGKITEVQDSLSKNSLYGIIGVLSAILLSGLLYWLLSKRQKKDRSDVRDMLSRSSENLLEQIKENSNSIGTNFLKELHEYSDLVALQFQSKQSSTDAKEPDHSLALKVASEINLIERNINLMDSKTKGLKGLQASVGKLKDNLSANGYEMPELLGKQFHQGMKVIVTSSIPDENLEKGSEIISKVLIPQVNYNDKMIQTAQIEVSVGY
jgi:hypothetical protein